MTAASLDGFTHRSGLVFYLDTSAVMPLALNEAGTIKGTELIRFRRINAFVASASRAASRTISSVLALEEIAAKTRNELSRAALKRAGHDDWRSYAAVAPAAAAAERTTIQGQVLKMLEHAATGMGKIGVVVEQPVVANAADAGKKVRKAHREYLRAYANIDSMDALHLAFGGLLGCKHFVSFDQAWLPISEVDVLN